MIDQEIKYVEKLLTAFFEGTTTEADEKELYRFFRRADVPEHLKPYRPVFDYFETGIREECRTLKQERYIMEKTKKRRWMLWVGIAASLLIFVSVGIQTHAGRKDFNPYEGSYIVRNGVRIDDPETIKLTLEMVMVRVNNRQQDMEVLLRRIAAAEAKEKQMKEELVDPRNQVLNQYKDERLRNEIRNLLEIE